MKNKSFNWRFLAISVLVCCSAMISVPVRAGNGVIKFKTKTTNGTIKMKIEPTEDATEAIIIRGVSNPTSYVKNKEVVYTLLGNEVEVSGPVEAIFFPKNDIISVDVQDHPTLRRIECQNNQITHFSVRNTPKLYWIKCNENRLTELYFKDLPLLEAVFCDRNQLTSLRFINCPELYRLGCEINNLDPKAMDLLVADFPNRNGREAVGLFYALDTRPEVKGVERNSCNKLQAAIAKGKKWHTFKRIPLPKDSDLDWINYQGSDIDDGIILVTNSAPGEKIKMEISATGDLEFSGIKDPDLFQSEQMIEYTLLSSVVTIKGQVTELEVKNANLASVDAATHKHLEVLACDSNAIRTFRIYESPNLGIVSCASNKLAELDLRGLSSLQCLDCSNNWLGKLSVSGLTELTDLYCSNNALGSLDLEGCKALSILHCQENQLRGKFFDAIIKNLPNLKSLDKEGELFVFNSQAEESTERNRFDTNQVQSAKSKGWLPYHFFDDQWTEYAGAEVVATGRITISNGRPVGEKIYCYVESLGDATIMGVDNPNDFVNGDFVEYTLTDKEVIIEGDIQKFNCSLNDMAAVRFDNCNHMISAVCYSNAIENLVFNNCPKLTEILCYGNKISTDKSMNALVNSLPDRSKMEKGIIDIYDPITGDKNYCTTEHVAILRSKNWIPYYKEGVDWLPYKGRPTNLEKVNMTNVSIYPNPASEAFLITNAPIGSRIALYSITGKCIRTTVSDQQGSAHLSVIDLPNGLYFLTIGNNRSKVYINK